MSGVWEAVFGDAPTRLYREFLTDKARQQSAAVSGHMWSGLQNVYTPPPAPRFRKINPKQPMGDKAALLLGVNHVLSAP